MIWLGFQNSLTETNLMTFQTTGPKLSYNDLVTSILVQYYKHTFITTEVALAHSPPNNVSTEQVYHDL